MNVRDAIVSRALSDTSIAAVTDTADDPVNPQHYRQHPSGVECIEIADGFNDYSIGNCIKYLWRAGLKSANGKGALRSKLEDLRKARWYLDRRINQLEQEAQKIDAARKDH